MCLRPLGVFVGRLLLPIVFIACGLHLLFPIAHAQPPLYRFERAWPSFQQPWSFNEPRGIAADSLGNLYIADASRDVIFKFDPDGRLLSIWDVAGFTPRGIALDAVDNVYVVDGFPARVLKFNSNGLLISSWTANVGGNPKGIAISESGIAYVVKGDTHQVAAFDLDGNFLFAFGSASAGDYYFNQPEGVAVGYAGRVYVTDVLASCIKVFDADGNYLFTFGQFGSGLGDVNQPFGIDIDDNGTVYVVERENERVQTFDFNGNWDLQWGTEGFGNGQFSEPDGVAVANGFVYTADHGLRRVQKFTKTGVYVSKWSRSGTGNGEFFSPFHMTRDSNNRIIVVDQANDRVQIFNSNGQFERAFGQTGFANGQFQVPTGVCVDSNDNIYVSDNSNVDIQKFNSLGVFQAKFDFDIGSSDGQFSSLQGIAVDSAGNIYAVDRFNHRIQKFNSAGTFVGKWGSDGTGTGQFKFPTDILIDPSDIIYVTDYLLNSNGRIHRFTTSGTTPATGPSEYGNTGHPLDLTNPIGLAWHPSGYLIAVDGSQVRPLVQYDSNGTPHAVLEDPNGGLFKNSEMKDAAVDSNGNLFLTGNARNQVFKLTPAIPAQVTKAIVVAGGGPFDGNNLWPATMSSAATSVWTLFNQGLTKDALTLLSPVELPDFDGNGIKDEFDSLATSANLQNAITTWATQDLNGQAVQDVVIYLVDHGGPGKFRLNETEILNFSTFAGWVNTLQAVIPGKVIIVYDACEAGSFVSTMGLPSANGKRIVIASSADNEQAHFVSSGAVSFSNLFWTQIFNGQSVGSSYTSASSVMAPFQTAQLDDNADGAANGGGDGPVAAGTFIGLHIAQGWTGPIIGTLGVPSSITNSNSANLFADNVSDPEGVSRVWAVISPPSYPGAEDTMPVTGLGTVDLYPVNATRWEGTYDGFVIPGMYTVRFYSMDGNGSISPTSGTFINVIDPPRRRHVIVGGGPQSSSQWPSIEWAASWVRTSLLYQGHKDAEINFLSQTSVAGVDSTATLANLHNAISFWGASNTRDLTITLIGPATPNGFWVNGTELLTWSELDNKLDGIQGYMPGPITVICDTDASGAMIPQLDPPLGAQRILISSTDPGQSATFANEGVMSFTRFFWSSVALGGTAGQSFLKAQEAMAFAAGQDAQLDDDSTGAYDTKFDGKLALKYSLGTGIQLSGDEPLIGSVSPPQDIGTQTSASFWVEDVTTLLTLDSILAVISPPDGGTPIEVPMTAGAGGRYEATFNGFGQFGTYNISISALDARGVSSDPAETSVTRPAPDSADAFEEDDSAAAAKWIGLDAFPDQLHTFHDAGDQDWATFYGTAGQIVTVETNNLGANVDTLVRVFRADGTTEVAMNDDRGLGNVSSYLNWTVDVSAMYLVKVAHSPNSALPGSGTGTQYRLRVWRETGPSLPGSLFVSVVNSGGGSVPGATVQINSTTPPWQVQQSTGAAGTFQFNGLAAGSYTVIASSGGQSSSPDAVNIPAGGNQNKVIMLAAGATGALQVNLTPPGAVTAGAQWRVDGGAFQNSGSTMSGLSAGLHSVSFKNVTGFVTPVSTNVTINSGQTTVIGGAYSAAQLATPQGLQASDGTFTDKIQVTWQAVANATGYRVYRSQTWDGGSATAIGDVSGTTYEDFSASAPNVTTPPGGCGGGGGTPQVNYITYVYWVQALGANGAQSNWCPPNDGYRGAGVKLLDAWSRAEGAPVFETALPTLTGADGMRVARSGDALALRIMADEAIDPFSLAGEVTWDAGSRGFVDWVEGEAGGWAVALPVPEWTVGSLVTLTVSASTVSGIPVEAVSRTFRIVEDTEFASLMPRMEGGIGNPILLDPTGPFLQPESVALNLPAGYGLGDIDLYYYLADGDRAGWHSAGTMVGFAAGIGPDGQLTVRHGGVVQFGLKAALEPAQSGIGMSSDFGGGAVVLMVALAVCVWLNRRNTWRPRARR
ncbi:MAG: hypothetical protein AMXMBFR84_41990 [Candidatus Hydrogenedentota bacterium]